MSEKTFKKAGGVVGAGATSGFDSFCFLTGLSAQAVKHAVINNEKIIVISLFVFIDVWIAFLGDNRLIDALLLINIPKTDGFEINI